MSLFPIETIEVAAFTIPTSSREADGTFEWSETTLVTVEVTAVGKTGFGYTYGSAAVGSVVDHALARHVLKADCMSPRSIYDAMVRGIRNLGRAGAASMAISAVDMAVFDLKARILEVSVLTLLGQVRSEIAVYGSGGFTSYTDEQLTDQLSCWVGEGLSAVKMKIGTHPERDLHRVRVAREAIGSAELYVDANGAYDRKQALSFAQRFKDYGVTWFEEPVTSDDLPGLRLLTQRAPAGMDIAAGEYGYDPPYFMRMLQADAVDVIQIDGTRCGGVTGFLLSAAVADAYHAPLSAHTAPSLHAHLCCAQPRARNVEYFHDHARIEDMLMEGCVRLSRGCLKPDTSCPGFGLRLKVADAERYRVFHARHDAD